MPRFYRPRRGMSLVELLVVIGIISILLGLLLPAVQQVRATAARATCGDRLRQIGLATHGHVAAYHALPPGVSVQGPDTTELYPQMSWLTRLLPYVEQDAVWQQADAAFRAVPADFRLAPHPFATPIRVFVCPTDARAVDVGMARGQFPAAFTSYLGVSGTRTSRRDGVLFKNSSVRLTDVTDGTSNTLMVGERPPSGDLWYGWWYAGYGADGAGKGDMLLGVQDTGSGQDPQVAECGTSEFRRGSLANLCDAFHYWSLHQNGGNFLFADGSVRFLTYASNEVLPALATRAGGEVVPGDY